MRRLGIVSVFLFQLVTLPGALCLSPSPAAHTNENETIRIDTHCHYIPGWYKDLLNSRNITYGGAAIPDWNVTAHLEMNDRFDVTTSVLSVSAPGAKLSENASTDEGRALARRLNEYGYNLTVLYPKRFLFFGVLTLPDVEGAIAEAIYALDILRAAGVILEASKFGVLLGTSRYERLYEVLNDHNATVFVHPGNDPCPKSSEEVNRSSTGLDPWVVDFLLDTTRAAANLVYRNVTRDYPNITFMLAHSGGFLPFAATRVAGGLAYLPGTPTQSRESTYYGDLSEFNVDLADSATRTALPSTTAFFNISRITWGSDYPQNFRGMQETADGLQDYAQLGTDAKARINYENAYNMFKKFLV